MQESSAPSLVRVLLLSGAALAGLVVVGVFAWHYFNDTQTIAAGIERARPWLAAWRAALFISLVGLWPRLINALADRYGWNDARRQHVASQRWRVAAWLVVIELAVVQNLIGKFVNGLVS